MASYASENPERPDWRYQEAYRRARRRVKARLSFFWHLASYVIVNLMLVFIYFATPTSAPAPAGQVPWFLWSLGGWGIGLLFHFLSVFVFPGNGTGKIPRWMIEQELGQLQAEPGPNQPDRPYSSSWPNVRPD